MEPITDPAAAQAAIGVARDAVTAVRATELFRLNGPELLDLAREVEHLARLVFTAQVTLAGELDAKGIAADHGCPSTAALLRHSLNISAADARARVATAHAILSRNGISGAPVPAALPELADALAVGAIGIDQTRTIVATMTGLPRTVDHLTRQACEHHLVDNAAHTEPHPFADFARAVALTCNPDGSSDDDADRARKVELTLGARHPGTGMTRFSGHLDDLGVEVLSQAIDGLAAPRPAIDNTPDPRTAACRRGQALVEALRHTLDLGDAPIQGGERPHITLTMRLDDLTSKLGAAHLDFGGAIDPGTARTLACDAQIIPAVLGTGSQVLDIGTARRLFPQPVRRAIALRDKGCTFPGCDRPPAWCDCHHVTYWTHHGPSSYTNGCLLCPHHHTLIHREEWSIRFAADGIPEFIPPPWIDPDQQPRRNRSHHLSALLTL